MQLLETPFGVHPIEREFCDKHSVKYLGKTESWQGKKNQQNGTVFNWPVSECLYNACSSIFLKLYLPLPHLSSAPLQPWVCLGIIVLATQKIKKKHLQSSKKHKSYSQVAKLGKTHRPVRGSSSLANATSVLRSSGPAVGVRISASTGIFTISLQRIPLAQHTDWKHPGNFFLKFAMFRDFCDLVSNQYHFWLC